VRASTLITLIRGPRRFVWILIAQKYSECVVLVIQIVKYVPKMFFKKNVRMVLGRGMVIVPIAIPWVVVERAVNQYVAILEEMKYRAASAGTLLTRMVVLVQARNFMSMIRVGMVLVQMEVNFAVVFVAAMRTMGVHLIVIIGLNIIVHPTQTFIGLDVKIVCVKRRVASPKDLNMCLVNHWVFVATQ